MGGPRHAGLEHRVGGLEKDSLTGMVSYDGKNHEQMVKTRAQKIANVVEDVPDLDGRTGRRRATCSSSSWGGTYGSVRTASEKLRAQGKSVAHVHLRWLNPMPKNLGAGARGRYKKVVVPEVNDGQLAQRAAHALPRRRPRPVQPDQRQAASRSPSSPAFVLEQL